MLGFVSFSFLTPTAAIVGAAAVLPVAAFVAGGRRAARVRAALGLPQPATTGARAIAAAAVVVLLAVAAAQPAVTTGSHVLARTDAGVLFVLDTSRSMAAARGRRAPTRLDRAIAAARQLRTAIPGVRAGIATLTDRVVPNLLPVTDRETFEATLDQAIGIEQPSPLEVQRRSTTFTALPEVPHGNYFEPSVRHRVAVLLTDGETRGFDAGAIARAFAGPPRTQLIAVQFWHTNEAVYTRHGHQEAGYSPDPTSRDLLENAMAAVHGEVFSERSLAAAARALRGMIGSGPMHEVRGPGRRHPLAPFVAVLALLPLAFVFVPRGVVRPRRTDVGAAQPSTSSSTEARRIRAASTNPSRS